MQVLPGLRHGAVAGVNHQEGVLHGGNAGHHVVDEAVVPRHIDEAENAAAFPPLVGKAKVYGQAASPLLGQYVRVHAGQRLDEAGLAVVHMAGQGHDHAGPSSRRDAKAPSKSTTERKSSQRAPC